MGCRDLKATGASRHEPGNLLSYSNVTPDGDTTLLAGNQGNAVSGSEFASDFSIVNPIFSITSKHWSQPVTLALEYMHNVDADVSEDEGYAVGIGFAMTGKLNPIVAAVAMVGSSLFVLTSSLALGVAYGSDDRSSRLGVAEGPEMTKREQNSTRAPELVA